MREFTDPFTGDILNNPTEKRYKVIYTIGNERRETEISTLSDATMTKERAKEKVGGPAQMMLGKDDITVKSVRKVDEVDKGGSSVFGFE